MKSVSPQKKIFISYRVQDTAGETGRLVDAAGKKSTFVFVQNGRVVGISVQASGQNLATGSGEINGQNVVLNLPLFGVATVVQLVLSAVGRQLSGTYTLQTTGVPKPIRLVKMQN